jgi:hypothetical protein
MSRARHLLLLPRRSALSVVDAAPSRVGGDLFASCRADLFAARSSVVAHQVIVGQPVIAHQIIVGQPELVRAGLLLVQSSLGTFPLGHGARQPCAMLRVLRRAGASLRRLTMLAHGLLTALRQQALATPLGRDPAAAGEGGQKNRHYDYGGNDDYNDQPSGHP